MKKKRVILSSIVCLLMAASAHASDCAGGECAILPMPVRESRPVAPAPVHESMQIVEYQPIYVVPEYSAKMLSVKPVPRDTRAPLWDGTHGKYVRRTADKTVDWRDGVPIWDDSIANYKQKDFSDWFLEPLPEFWADEMPVATYAADVDVMALYGDTMADAAATRARVEELLTPSRPSASLWVNDVVVADDDVVELAECDTADVVDSEPVVTASVDVPAPRPKYMAQDMTAAINAAFGGDACPFETTAECEIWRKKPIVREVVAPRSNHLRADLMTEFIDAARCDAGIDASNPVAAPLVARYKMLMQSANACCTDGMVYALRNAGASDGLIYKFMSDDANFYGFGSRCLMMTDAELDKKYPNTSTAAVAADVRNGCLCRGRQWFDAMLSPFRDAYAAVPEFASEMFYYDYTDGLGRRVRVSINNDVQNVLRQLAQCP